MKNHIPSIFLQFARNDLYSITSLQSFTSESKDVKVEAMCVRDIIELRNLSHSKQVK